MTNHVTSSADLSAVLARVRRRIIPFLFLLYIVSYLDRINVGFAALQMNRALGLSATAYGLGAGIFFLSYTAFEIPSNLILVRVGARLWIARIMITWGLISAAMMLARTPTHFFVLRFLLGAAEAGFFPGVIYYLTQWFPRHERARTIAAFMTATLIAGVIGGPVSGVLLTMNGLGGLAGWQWLFLLEGLPAVLLGVIVLGFLTNSPGDAEWLSVDERRVLVTALEHDSAGVGDGHHGAAAGLKQGRIWILAAIYFTMVVALYVMGFWLPQMIKAHSGGSDLEVGLLSALPYLVGACAMVATARHSDQTGERRWHLTAGGLVAGVAFAASALTGSLVPSLVTLAIGMLGLASMFGPFWALSTAPLGGVGAATAIALINSVGNTGGFAGPYMVGYLRDLTHSFTWGLVVIGLVIAFVPVLALTIDRGERAQLPPVV